MSQQDRGVSPVIGVILMLAITVVLATTISALTLGVTEDINDPAPNIAQATGEFVVDDPDAFANQIVRITHKAGDNVPVEQLEIVVRASGPEVDTEARLVNLPAEDTQLDPKNLEDPDNIVDNGNDNRNSVIISDDTNVWAAGDAITFRINTGDADFRVDEENTGPEADRLEVLIIHAPSNSILSEHTLNP